MNIRVRTCIKRSSYPEPYVTFKADENPACRRRGPHPDGKRADPGVQARYRCNRDCGPAVKSPLALPESKRCLPSSALREGFSDELNIPNSEKIGGDLSDRYMYRSEQIRRSVEG